MMIKGPSSFAEEVASCLAKEARSRRDKKRGFHEVDDMADALEPLGYIEEAERLEAKGVQIIGGKLVI